MVVALGSHFPEPDEAWHPLAQRWFRSLGESGQRIFYEASDIAYASYVAEAMTRNLAAGRFSAQLFTAVSSAMTELLTSEGARRRVGLDLDRANAGDEDAEVIDWRSRLDDRDGD